MSDHFFYHIREMNHSSENDWNLKNKEMEYQNSLLHASSFNNSSGVLHGKKSF